MLLVYVDGGTRKGVGSWAYALVSASVDSIKDDYAGRLSGKVVAWNFGKHPAPLHSSHMELLAALNGVKRAIALTHGYTDFPITVVSDSHYVTKGFPSANTRLRAAIASHGEAIEAEGLVALWKEIIPICAFHNISTQHVKGHRLQTGNTLVDYLCGEVLKGRTVDEINHQVKLFRSSKIWRHSLVRTRR